MTARVRSWGYTIDKDGFTIEVKIRGANAREAINGLFHWAIWKRKFFEKTNQLNSEDYG